MKQESDGFSRAECQWQRFGYDCEFLDDKGNYHHWKQWDDGGEVVGQEKRYYDCYGTDVTDVFKKYGYC